MLEQVCGVVVHPIRPRALQLIRAIAAGQEPDAEHARAARGEHVPDAVADHHRIDHIDPELAHGLEEQIGIGFGVGHEITGDDRHAVRQAQQLERRAGGGHPAAGRDREGAAELGEPRQQGARPRQRAHLADATPVRLGVPVLHAHEQGLVQRASGLAQQRAREQAAAHADAPVDAPHRELDTSLLQRLVPRQHVLIDAVDQRAVEIEDQGRCRHVSLPRRRGDRDLRLCCRASGPVGRNPIDLLAARRRAAAITMWPPPRVAAASPSLWLARHAHRPSAPPSPERVRCGPPARCRPSRPAPALGRCRAGRSPAPA